jgi:hypothetical protein
MFGTGFGTAFSMWVTNRSRNVHPMAVVSKCVVLADYLFTAPAVVLQPASRLMMTHMAGYETRASLSNVAGRNWLGAAFLALCRCGCVLACGRLAPGTHEQPLGRGQPHATAERSRPCTGLPVRIAKTSVQSHRVYRFATRAAKKKRAQVGRVFFSAGR